MKDSYLAVGLMSGTSLDGVDAALIRTDGEYYLDNSFESITVPYDEATKTAIKELIAGNETNLSKITDKLTHIHIYALALVVKKNNFWAKDIKVVGFHGQTISHHPELGFSRQIGNAKLLADLTTISVVNDFRNNDIKNGGQGAPLVPIYHQILAKNLPKPAIIVNIGGVANVTFIGENVNLDTGENLLAFDTGPGNALIDDLIYQHNQGDYDKDGAIARSGSIDFLVLDKLLSSPYFKKLPPKSLDRNEFKNDLLNSLSLADAAATLTAFTVYSLLESIKFLPSLPKTWLITGGGRYNKFMLELLEAELNKQKSGIKVASIDSIGVNGDAIEAEAFAYLAVRTLKNLPISFPTTTGCKTPTVGGVITLR